MFIVLPSAGIVSAIRSHLWWLSLRSERIFLFWNGRVIKLGNISSAWHILATQQQLMSKWMMNQLGPRAASHITLGWLGSSWHFRKMVHACSWNFLPGQVAPVSPYVFLGHCSLFFFLLFAGQVPVCQGFSSNVVKIPEWNAPGIVRWTPSIVEHFSYDSELCYYPTVGTRVYWISWGHHRQMDNGVARTTAWGQLPGFEFRFHLWKAGPGESCLTSPCLSFLIYKARDNHSTYFIGYYKEQMS